MKLDTHMWHIFGQGETFVATDLLDLSEIRILLVTQRFPIEYEFKHTQYSKIVFRVNESPRDRWNQ